MTASILTELVSKLSPTDLKEPQLLGESDYISTLPSPLRLA